MRPKANNPNTITEHFFRHEYGKMVAIITKYLGAGQIETAEDIVQETLLTAVEYWQHTSIPPNPVAWLYTTAKNKAFNILKHQKYTLKFEKESIRETGTDKIPFPGEEIADEQLRMIFICCDPIIPENSQIALILKILCGFSISEIAAAFFVNNDTINKRLVRGRKQLKEVHFISIPSPEINTRCDTVLKTIYLLFNEGYLPATKNGVIRTDFCFEAIRLTKMLASHPKVDQKTDCHALLSLMYLNVSRFEARTKGGSEIIEMEKQDRSLWNQKLINKGLYHLDQALAEKTVSNYLLLASISANHCIARSYEETNWKEILSFYDALLKIENSPVIRLNRAVALLKVKGSAAAIAVLETLENQNELTGNYLLYALMGELYKQRSDWKKAVKYLNEAIKLCSNNRDKIFLRKKLEEVVPISGIQL